MTKIFILFVLLAWPAFAGTQTLVPTAISTSSNFSSCTIDLIDEDPDSTDGSWCVSTGNNVDTSVRVDFATPTDPPQDGAGLQEFRVLVRPFDSGQTGDPDFTVQVTNGGAADAVTSCNPTNILNTSGEVVYSCTWDSTDLDTNDGSTVQMDFVCSATGGSPGTRNTCDFGAVEWNADTSAVNSRHIILAEN